MDERGWENPECGYEEKAHDSGGVDGLGSEGKAMVSFGLSGGCDGGVWDRVDDLTDQLFDVKKEKLSSIIATVPERWRNSFELSSF